MLFNGTNYHDWLLHMHLHMHSLRLWEFLTGELPCPLSTLAPAQPLIMERTTAVEKEVLLTNYDDRLALYESQFHANRTWLDENAWTGLVLVVSMED
jgi:hypothetical protein